MLALGLILGGTVGNLIDRAFIGHVTDFLKVGPWPDFNVADSSLVVGGILLAFNLIRASRTEGIDGTTGSADRGYSAGGRLDLFIVQKLPELSRSYIQNLIEDGHVMLNGKPPRPGFEAESGRFRSQ